MFTGHRRLLPSSEKLKAMNDLSPVALTLVVAKCYERLVCNQQTSAVANRLDPLQCAYRAGEGLKMQP